MNVFEKIRRLIELMRENDLAELELEEPELRVKLRTKLGAQYSDSSVGGASDLEMLPGPHAGPREGAEEPGEAQRRAQEELLEITSPMVGTFYRSPSEGAEPYVTVGSVIEPETVVCIIEAMKVMNEVKAGIAGEVAEILVQNGEPVEFGQVLFLARPPEE